jgi:pimeloyl-ACP methyl ester carboxylesterase
VPHLISNGIRLAYQRGGEGECVLFIMGSGCSGQVWTMYQTPALRRAGYQTITFDNRGIAPSDVPSGKYSLDDLVADTRGLIEALELGPCRIVGTSLGAMITQELAIHAPELVRSAVLIATRARSDRFRRALSTAEQVLRERNLQLPPEYDAVMSVLQMLSPATLADDAAVSPLLDLFELSSARDAQNGQAWIDTVSDRRESLRRIGVPCRVVAFADDLITPLYLATEVADLIPDCDLVRIPDAGHLGYLEHPDQVNRAIIEFFDRH